LVNTSDKERLHGMGQEVARIEGDGLTELQARFVEALLDGASPEEAKKIAGYADTTPTVSILRGKLVENAISAAVDNRMRGDLKIKALNTLEKLMDGSSAQAALGAAKIVFDYAKDSDQADDTPLSERPTAELEAMIDQLEREREARMKDVTPSNGA
jgi:hypothetical protein